MVIDFQKHNCQDKQGFTLVEMSIVVIIIGIIITGVATGTSMINQVRLNSVISDYNKFLTALTGFKAQYNAIPGDMLNASAYWPTCDIIPTNCNGNGNGIIEWGPGNSSTDVNSEVARFWQHLSLSGFLAEQYKAVLDGSGNEIIGLTVPASKYRSVNGQPSYWIISGWDSTFTLSARNPISGPYAPDLDAVAPADGYVIDQKIDDGNGNTGMVIAGVPKTAESGGWNWGAKCRVDYDGSWITPTPAGPIWQIENTGPGCILVMRINSILN